MSKDVFARQVLRKLADMEALMVDVYEENQYLRKKMDKLERQFASNEQIDPHKDYKARDLMRFLKKGKNAVNDLLKNGVIPALKQAGKGGYKVRGIDLLNYIQEKRAKDEAVWPNAARQA